MIRLLYFVLLTTTKILLLFLSSLCIFVTSIIPYNMSAKRSFTTSYSLPSSNNPYQFLEQQRTQLAGVVVPNMGSTRKKLRRLPHVFNKVLELPFNADADVFVQEHHDCFEFVANVSDELGNVGVKTHVVNVHPGIIKVVIRRRDNVPFSRSFDELEFDVWRFRLPVSARAELATAVNARGQLVVVVPKVGWGENNSKVCDCKGGGFKGNMGNLVLVH